MQQLSANLDACEEGPLVQGIPVIHGHILFVLYSTYRIKHIMLQCT